MTIKPKVLLTANTSWYLYNFRLQLLYDIAENGYEVECVAPIDKYSKLLIKKGFNINEWKLDRKSTNPFSELMSVYSLYKIYKNKKPLIVHHFTIKACIYGTISARLLNTRKILNAFTGLGHLFITKNILKKILFNLIKPFLNFILISKKSKIILQNEDDKLSLYCLGIIKSKGVSVIRGSGVNINFFKPSKIEKKEFNKPFQLFFPSRLIKEKGILELLKACDKLWNKSYNFELLIAGAIDKGNPSSLNENEYQLLKKNKLIKLLGHVDNIKEIYENVDLVILPSWREGLSRILIEASAMEKPIITTNTPGCRDIIEHEINGLLVNINSPEEIERAIIMIMRNFSIAQKYGKNARKNVLQNFDVSIINKLTLEHYKISSNKNI